LNRAENMTALFRFGDNSTAEAEVSFVGSGELTIQTPSAPTAGDAQLQLFFDDKPYARQQLVFSYQTRTKAFLFIPRLNEF